MTTTAPPKEIRYVKEWEDEEKSLNPNVPASKA
jgi:hypothetical protein